MNEDEELELEMEMARAKAASTQKQETEIGQKQPAPSPVQGAMPEQPEIPMDVDPGIRTQAASLPMPTDNMYEGMSAEDASALYQSYLNHPLTEQGGLNTTYRGVKLPRPVADFNPAADIAGGVWNAGKEGLVSLVGAGEVAGKYLRSKLRPNAGPGPASRAERLQEFIPEYEPKGTADKMITEGVQFAAGALGPGKIKTAAVGVPRFLQAVGKYAASIMGGTATVDDDTQGILEQFTSNPDVLTKLVGVYRDENGNYSEELAKKKLGLFMEGFAIAKPAELGARGVGAAGKFLGDQLTALTQWQSLAAKDKAVAQEFIDVVASINPMDTPEQVAQKIAKMSSDIKAGTNIGFESGIEGVDDVALKRPTVGAMLEGGKGTIPPEQVARATGIHATALNKGSGQLEAQVGAPSRSLDKALGQTREAMGGAESVTAAKDAVLKSADDEVANLNQGVSRAEADVDLANRDLIGTVKDDPYVGETLRNAQTGKLDLRTSVNDSADEIVDQYTTGRYDLKEEGDKLFEKVPANTKYDQTSFDEAYKSVEDFVPEDIKKLIAASDGTYAYLRNKIGTQLQKEIDHQFTRGNARIGEALTPLRDNIYKTQDQILLDRGITKTPKAYKQAVTEFKAKQAPYQQGPGEDIYRIQRSKATTEKKFGKPDEAAVESRKILKGTLDDPDQLEHSQRILSLVDDEAKDSYIRHRVAEDLTDKLSKGTLKDLDVSALRKSLRPYAQLMQDKGKSLNDLVNNLDRKKGNIGEMETQVKALRDQTKTEIDRIYNKELGKFLDSSGLREKDADRVFAKFLSDDDGANALAKLQERIGDNELAQKGLKSAYSRYLGNQIFRTGQKGGSPNLNETVVKNAKSGESRLLEYGDQIFGKDSKEMKMFRGLIDEGQKNLNLGSSKKVPVEDVNLADKRARQGFDFFVTQLYGQLSRAGARIRSIGGRVASSATTRQQQLDAIDRFFSDPELAARKLDEIAGEYSKKMDKPNKNRIIDSLILSGLWKDPVDEQTNDALKK